MFSEVKKARYFIILGKYNNDKEPKVTKTRIPCFLSNYVLLLVQSLSHVWLFATSMNCSQASLSSAISQSLLKPMSIELVMPFNHPLSPASHPAFNLFQHWGLFQWVGSSQQVAKILELQLQHQSFQWIFKKVTFRLLTSLLNQFTNIFSTKFIK